MLLNANQIDNNLWGAIGRIPSGLFILTSRHGGKREGMLVSWVQQAGFVPPLVIVAIALDRPICALIEAAGTFALCQVRDGDVELLRRFAKPHGCGDPFDGVPLIDDSESGMVIPSACAGFLVCQFIRRISTCGDHELLSGVVRNGRVLDGSPFVHLRKTGRRY